MSMTTNDFNTTYEECLRDIMFADERYIVLTAENHASIRNLPHVIGNRFIDVGIAEQSMIGIASGLALRGRIPIVHALSSFLTMRAFEFIRTDIGIPNLTVKLIGGVPGFLSEANGPTHQAIEDIALMRVIPNMCIFCPSDREDLVIGLRDVLESNNPFYIRLNHLPPAIVHDRSFEIGSAETVAEGNDVAILVYGTLLGEAMEATRLLEEKGLSVRLLNLRTLKPVDAYKVLSAAEDTSLLVTIEDHLLTGGLFSIVSELLTKNSVVSSVLPISLNDRWFRPSTLKDILEYEGFQGRFIAEKILRFLNGGRLHA